MKVLLTGFVPGEGRHSMVRTARTLHQTLGGLLPAGDQAVLLGGGSTAHALNTRGWQIKLQKRILLPLSLRFTACDVLHLVDSDYAAAIPSARLAHSVVTCHDLMPLLMAPRLEEVFSPLGVRLFRRSLTCMERAARIVCDSEFTRQTVLRFTACRPERLSVVPLGVEPAFHPLSTAQTQAFRARHGIEAGPLVLHVGSAEGYKNIETLLTVVARLRREAVPALRLLKVGGRFTAAHLDAIQSEGLADAVIHLTGLDESELVAAYNAADLLLWPSHFEGFGWPVLEAMACGTPVVCSNGGSLPEVAGDAAAVCNPTDADGLVAACTRILSDAAHAEDLRTRGRAWAASFTWERTARAYLEVYRAVAQEAAA